MFEPMMKFLRLLAEEKVTTGDHYTRTAASDFIAADDLRMQDEAKDKAEFAEGVDLPADTFLFDEPSGN